MPAQEAPQASGLRQGCFVKLGKVGVCILWTIRALPSNRGRGELLAAKDSVLLGTQVSCHVQAARRKKTDHG